MSGLEMDVGRRRNNQQKHIGFYRGSHRERNGAHLTGVSADLSGGRTHQPQQVHGGD